MSYKEYLAKKKGERSDAFTGLIGMDHQRETDFKPSDEVFQKAMWEPTGFYSIITEILYEADFIRAYEITEPVSSIGDLKESYFRARFNDALSNSGDGSDGLYPNGAESQDINEDARLLRDVEVSIDEDSSSDVYSTVEAVYDTISSGTLTSSIIDRNTYEYYRALRDLDNNDYTQYGAFLEGDIIGPSEGNRTVEMLGGSIEGTDDSHPDSRVSNGNVDPSDGAGPPARQEEIENPDSGIPEWKWTQMEEGTDYEVVTFRRYYLKDRTPIDNDVIDALQSYIDFIEDAKTTWQQIKDDYDSSEAAEVTGPLEDGNLIDTWLTDASSRQEDLNTFIQELQDELDRVETILAGDDSDYSPLDELPEQEGNSGEDDRTVDEDRATTLLDPDTENTLYWWLDNIVSELNDWATRVVSYFQDGFISGGAEEDLNHWKNMPLQARIEKPSGTYTRVRTTERALSSDRDAVIKAKNNLVEANTSAEEFLEAPSVITAYYEPLFDIDDNLKETRNVVIGMGAGHATTLRVYRAEGSDIQHYMIDPDPVEDQWENVYDTYTERLTDNDNSLEMKYKETIDKEDRGKLYWYRISLEDAPDDSPLTEDATGGNIGQLYPNGDTTYSPKSSLWRISPDDNVKGEVIKHREINGVGTGTEVQIQGIEESVKDDYQLQESGYMFFVDTDGVYQLAKIAEDKIVVYPQLDKDEGDEVTLAAPYGLVNSMEL